MKITAQNKPGGAGKTTRLEMLEQRLEAPFTAGEQEEMRAARRNLIQEFPPETPQQHRLIDAAVTGHALSCRAVLVEKELLEQTMDRIRREKNASGPIGFDAAYALAFEDLCRDGSIDALSRFEERANKRFFNASRRIGKIWRRREQAQPAN